MKILSPVFEPMNSIPSKYTCDGGNINPPLKFEDIPQDAKSLVLIVDDPDAPVGLWVHWTLWNIRPGIIEIRENTVPEGAVEGITDFGRPGYGGPCPPDGEHRYFFKLYALDIILDLDQKTAKPELEKEICGHIIAQAELVGLYNKK